MIKKLIKWFKRDGERQNITMFYSKEGLSTLYWFLLNRENFEKLFSKMGIDFTQLKEIDNKLNS